MKSLSSLISGALVLSAMLVACGATDEDSQVKMNAVPTYESNSVVRVRDAESIFFAYVTVNPQSGARKGYRFDCDTIPKLRRLISSTGFPTDFLSSTPIYDFDSKDAQDLKLDEQPRLSCSNPDKALYKVDFADKTRFFFADTSKSRTRLYNLGCQSLVDNMGFQIDAATTVTPDFISNLKIFSADDNDDISCIGGIEIGAKLQWTTPTNSILTLKKADRLPLTTFAARKADGTQAALTLARTGKCDWVESTAVNGALLITGQTPYDFQGQVSCTLEIKAEEGSSRAESKTFQINALPLPVESNGWIRDPLSDTGVGGALGEAGDGLCNGKENCVYNDPRGRLWSRVDNTYRNFDDAQTFCFKLVYGGYSDWRLPTVAELKQAVTDKVYDLAPIDKLDLYSYSWSVNVVPTDTTQAYYVSLIDGTDRPLTKKTVLMHNCIR
ncbi:MAG TPA: DUF1566 domain-containing protein [Oligoflexus sp.]|uniref:Lcl domain-containing protein n=1 Tax=Oligoflexus sp. TaxID=1971216 RepID=UPI002D7F3DC5|nr:DUF1566 domain-containing protein [Oligoflexus sp.]HET9240231.1 DUF1566 domain-containing protein [Oligoflexus sp.]